MEEKTKLLLKPFLLTAAIILLDQVTKHIIVRTVPLHTVGANVIGDFFRIVHVRNLGIAFSIGRSAASEARSILFTLLPIVLMAVLIIYYFRTREFTRAQRWAIAGIVGGGFGNIIDRIFRPLGVVDFLDFKFYGLFGLERWPTFNVADMSVVICGILLFFLFLFQKKESVSDEQED